MSQQRVRRLLSFFAVMENAPPCDSRASAFELAHASWLQVNAASENPDKDIEAFKHLQLTEDCGWQQLDSDPCFLSSIERTGLCLYLHHDGSIVIQDLQSASQPILLSKPGAAKFGHKEDAECFLNS